MKRIGLIVTFCLAWMVSESAARDVTEQKTFEETVSFTAGGEVRLDNQNGGIEVRTWDRNEVRVWARIKAQGRDRAEAEEMLDEVEIRIEQNGDHLEIYSDHPRGGWGWGRSVNVVYELTVPEKIDLDLDTVNGGIEVGTIEGQVRLTTSNGNIEVDRVHGSVTAKTTNGGIDVELAAFDGSEDLEYTTTNGSINVSLPKDIKGSFEAKTTNGHIETDFPITVRGKFSRKSIRGDLNGGGSTLIRLKTTNGSIYIREVY